MCLVYERVPEKPNSPGKFPKKNAARKTAVEALTLTHCKLDAEVEQASPCETLKGQTPAVGVSYVTHSPETNSLPLEAAGSRLLSQDERVSVDNRMEE